MKKILVKRVELRDTKRVQGKRQIFQTHIPLLRGLKSFSGKLVEVLQYEMGKSLFS